MRNNLGLFLTKRAQMSPAMDGLVDCDTDRRFSFRQWNERTNRTAHLLLEGGVKKGDRVALLLMNGIEYCEAFLAVAKIGAVCVPLNWRLTPEELTFILADAGAETLIFGEEFSGSAIDLEARGSGDSGTAIKTWLHVGAKDRPPFAESYNDRVAGQSSTEPVIGASDDDLLYIMYTSGTTGLPKGAVHTHDSAIWAVLTCNATTDTRIGDRYLLALPLFHVGALMPLTANIHRGATSVVMRAFDPKRAWQLVHDEKVTTGLKVPAMLNFMLQVYEKGRYDHSHLRYFWSGAAPVPVSLIEAYAAMGIEIHQVYGLTETCGPACVIGTDDALSRAGSTGRAFFHTDVKVVNAEGGIVSAGESGEVLVRGKHLMKEYWKRPEATAETLVNGWLRTGDVATVDEDGFVFIQDRIKDMIISGGENIYPAEIESVLVRHEKILEAGVIGHQSAKWGESPVAIVVRSDESLCERDVLDFCKDKLARFKQPVKVEFIDLLPRNPSGKILKRQLREQFPGPAAE